MAGFEQIQVTEHEFPTGIHKQSCKNHLQLSSPKQEQHYVQSEKAGSGSSQVGHACPEGKHHSTRIAIN